MSDDLMKPCPFCGSSNIKSGGDDKIIGYWCLDCEAVGPNHYGCYEWNSRADRNEELEAKLRKSALQELSALDQASEAYQAQLAAEAKLAKAVVALKECEEEIDAYIQIQYPHNHMFQEIYRQRDYATNPARVALAELTGGKDE